MHNRSIVMTTTERLRMNVRRAGSIALALVAVAAASACGSSGGTTTVTKSQASGGGNSKVLVGAGSTFVAPLVQQWEADYVKSPAAVTVTYGAIGSGGGVDQITARTVDFGASDAPLSADQAAACKGCIQIPWSLGAVAITYNVKGLQNKIHLTGPVIADMFMGKVTSWNDPEIAKLNPGVSLPDTHITPVYRSDGSGTSFAFTDWLTKVSPDWANNVGTSTQPPFPTGTGAEHSSGVVAAVQATDASSECSGQLSGARHQVRDRSGEGRDVEPRRLDLAREPARLGGGCVPGRDVHLRHRAAELAQGIDAEGLPEVRDRADGPGIWASPWIPEAALLHRRERPAADRQDRLLNRLERSAGTTLPRCRRPRPC
jgi:ABC-type phosphate transport system substrate-binding protein